MFNKKRKDKPVKMPSSLLEGEDYCYDKARAGYIDKLHVLPCVKALLKLMLISISEDGFERFILACKVFIVRDFLKFVVKSGICDAST